MHDPSTRIGCVARTIERPLRVPSLRGSKEKAPDDSESPGASNVGFAPSSDLRSAKVLSARLNIDRALLPEAAPLCAFTTKGDKILNRAFSLAVPALATR